jgi:hypothetical protein
MPSITITSANLQVDGPVLEVHFLISKELEEKLKKEGKSIPEPVVIKAQIDTGASNCVVQEDIPKKLGLQPIGSVKIATPSSRDHLCYTYYMRMLIPAQKITYDGIFTAAPLAGQNISSLIGRDLLAHGILIYIGYAKQFTLSLL